MNIEKHIIDLLYYHDCVILPEFGGFVVNYQEAQIDFQQQKLSPPARVLAFNQSLTINDGLLINAVSQLEKISYEEAANAVSEYVKQLQNELKNNSALNIENIGKFSFTNNIIEFHPTGNHNFLLGSYGLSDFHYPMLRTPKPQQIVEEAKKEIVDKIINNKTRKPSWGIAIPVAAASIALAVLFFNQTHIPKTNLTNNQMSSISIPSITSDKSSASLEYNTV
ncbi:MAG: hypothetical protein GX879_07120, partial [Bacteroidales bacterium]|nr:hypothetical protein [Bacteroidales bacterium]